MDHSRNKRIIQELNRFGNYDELSVQLEDILTNLSFGTVAEKAENAFYRIGQLLGYISQRTEKEIRKGPDVLWCVANGKYVLIECKTEVLPSRRTIYKKEAGQMEQHCAWFESEYGQDTYIPMMVIPTKPLSDDAFFSHNVRVLIKSNLEVMKNQIRDFFKEFKEYEFASIEPDLINRQLVANNLYDNNFIEKLLEQPKK